MVFPHHLPHGEEKNKKRKKKNRREERRCRYMASPAEVNHAHDPGSFANHESLRQRYGHWICNHRLDQTLVFKGLKTPRVVEAENLGTILIDFVDIVKFWFPFLLLFAVRLFRPGLCGQCR